MLRALATLALLLLAGCSTGQETRPGAPTTGPAPQLATERFLSGLDDPVFLTNAGDGSGRMYVVEQKGFVRVWDPDAGRILEEPFLDIASGGRNAKVLAGGERGLLGLAFHPGYAENGRFFVYYTASNGDVTIAEYRNPDPEGNVADSASGKVLLTQEHRKYPNHNGGALAFGPDGMLYAGIGDGGSGGDPDNNAQDLDTLLGKVIRIDVDTSVGSKPYTIPEGNPFSNRAGRDEVWMYGLRNPWRMSFDRDTGDLWIADVGQNQWEEVNHAPAGQGGQNYGWSRFEGTHRFSDRQAPGAIDPVAEYSHGEDGVGHCSVTGGYVYRGREIPALQGAYVFGDFCSGMVWALVEDGDTWTRQRVLDLPGSIASFGEDEASELYVVGHGGGIDRLVAR